jgi:hypothetical protein
VVALILFSGVVAKAEDALQSAGLAGMQVISDEDGTQVRGMDSEVIGTGLSSIAGIIYDQGSGSRFNLDSVHFNSGSDENAGVGEESAVQFETLAGIQGFAVTITTNNSAFTASFDAISLGVNWAGGAIAVPNLNGLLGAFVEPL